MRTNVAEAEAPTLSASTYIPRATRRSRLSGGTNPTRDGHACDEYLAGAYRHDGEPDRRAQLRGGRRRGPRGPQLPQVRQLRADRDRAIPVYLVPSRNGYGIIGPIPPAQLAPQAIAQAVAGHPLARAAADGAPVYAVITNSTYDGLCYGADRVVDLLGQSVPRLHFDEAWFAYARFHPLYASRYAMHDRDAAGDPTIFAPPASGLGSQRRPGHR
jgi:hypothetical protein